MREHLLYTLFEEIIEKNLGLTNSVEYAKKLSYLSKDENACLCEMLECWFEEH